MVHKFWVLKPLLMKFIRCVARHDEKTSSVTRSDVTTFCSITSVGEVKQCSLDVGIMQRSIVRARPNSTV